MSITVTVTPPLVVPAIQSGATVQVTASGDVSAGTLGLILRISVANIDDPSAEMAAIAGVLPKGTVRIAYQTVAGADATRIYWLDDASSDAQSTPNRIDRAAGGQWVLIGGKGVNSSWAVNGALTVGGTAAIAGAITSTLVSGAALAIGSTTAGASGGVGSITTAGGIYAAAASFFGGQLLVERSASTNNYGAGQVTGEATARLTMRVDGLFGFGDGTSTRDVGFARNAAGVLEINSATAGTLRDLTLRNLTSSTTIAGSALTLTDAATLSKVTGTTLAVASTAAASVTLAGGMTVAGTYVGTDTVSITVAAAVCFTAISTGASSSSGGCLNVVGNNDGAAQASGDRLGGYIMRGARDGAGAITNAAGIFAFTTEAWGSGASGTEVRIETVANAGTTRATAATFGQDKSLTVVGLLTANSDTDGTTILGRSKVGSPASDQAVWSHFDHQSTTNFALRQDSGGGTTLNVASGQTLEFAVAGSTKFSMTATGFNVTSGLTMNVANTTDATAAAGALQCDGGVRLAKRLVFSGTSSFSGGITTGYLYSTADGLVVVGSAGSTYSFIFVNSAGTQQFSGYHGVASVAVGSTSGLATNATDGFLYIPTCAGTPTGAPTAREGGNVLPVVIDRTNNKIYFYSGGAWRDAGP